MGIAEKKISSAALAECTGVWLHLLGACVSACVQQEGALSLIALKPFADNVVESNRVW